MQLSRCTRQSLHYITNPQITKLRSQLWVAAEERNQVPPRTGNTCSQIIHITHFHEIQ
ncbi:hypothetical protein E2C01_042016 [Portunus trituberculatus]|uniref:Uncharacterized protein n=1 Tax=Portunus trituberculatus TaxID=210409 RepID=A0A5B7FTF1_PORTR|nr:hypothetical protein [Portunus trituberculatus]